MSLPKGWVEMTLGEVGKIVTGKTPKKKYPEFFNGKHPFVKPSDLDKDIFVIETVETLSDSGLETVPNLPKGSVMVTCIGNMGKVGIAGQVVATNQQINSIIPNDEIIDSKYLYYYAKTLKPWMDRESSATTIAIINKSKFSTAPIMLPSLIQQKQIAQKLDKLLVRVERIKTALDNAPARIKRFRQSVLSSAVGGALIKNITFNKLPLNKLGSISGGKTPSKSNLEYWTDGSVFWVSAKDMKQFEIDSSIDRITDKAVTEAKMKLIPINSILMVTRSGILAHTFPIAINTTEITINQDLKAFNVNSEIVNYKFLAYILKGESQSILIECSKDGTTVPSVSTEKLLNYKLNIPPLKEQKAIVKKVETLFAIADKMEANLLEAKKQVDRLTQSILAKAFRGEL